MINKIIHQIWIGKYDIPPRELQFMNKIKGNCSNHEYYYWNNNNLPEIPERLKEWYDVMYKKEQYVYCADIIRWLVVYQYGGWYVDVDFELISNIDNYDVSNKSGVLFGHWGEGWQCCDYTIANNLFAFEKNHELIKYIIDNMSYGQGCSPSWTGIIIKKYLGLENEFSKEIWEYHRIMKQHLEEHNIEYGDYNKFQNEILKHYCGAHIFHQPDGSGIY